MPAPSYSQIKSFSNVRKELYNAAVSEFTKSIADGMTEEQIAEVAATIAAKFRLLGSELGAQWYDLCAQIAGVDVLPADVEPYDLEGMRENAKRAYATVPPGESVKTYFSNFITDQIRYAINETGQDNLWRDYGRGVRGGRWARVPVGETCAWCLMLASNGAWYLTEESALRREAGHFHRHCDCIAVYYANANSIEGYGSTLAKYKNMYYQADNRRIANNNGYDPYPDELQERVSSAKADHERKNEERMSLGLDPVPWSVANEDAIIMRELFGLK